MKKLIMIVMLALTVPVFAQEKANEKVKIYNPQANARADIDGMRPCWPALATRSGLAFRYF